MVAVVIALLLTAGQWGIVIGLCEGTFIGLAAPFAKIMGLEMSPAEAAVWAPFWGFLLALYLCLILPNGWVM